MSISLERIGSYRTGVFDENAAEIVAHDPTTQRLFITNGFDNTVDVVSITDPANPTKLFTLEFPAPFEGLAATSVAVRDGIVAVAVPADPETDTGHVLFFDTSGAFQSSVEVGAQPDMLTFTPDGQEILVANEGQLDNDTGVDPDGSVSIIDISSGLDSISVTIADFTAFIGQEDALRAEGVRIFDGKTVAQDVEPEFIAVAPDGNTAFATLQENNAFAVIDISTATVTAILPLGYKDHSAPGNGLDASDRDNAINIQNWPVFGMYQPDPIVSFGAGGETYYVTANEGDERKDDDERVKELDLDPVAFPDAETLQMDENLGRLDVSIFDGDLDGDGDYDQLFSFGGRSFSIWDDAGEQVFDSGDQFEQITATAFPKNFNPDEAENDFDAHSDAHGPEPAGLAVGQINGETYAFIALEDIGGVMVYNVSDPFAPTFQTYRNDRDFSVEPGVGDAGDLAPEGIAFITASDSPTRKPMLAVTYTVSGSTTLYEIETPGVEKIGTDGDDPLDGTSGDDTLIGLGGDDTLNGLNGDDDLHGDGERGEECVEVSFVSEEAGHRSTYGWYDTETLEARILVANVDTVTNPDIEDLAVGLPLPADQLATLGFFLIPDGYDENPGALQLLALGDPTALDLEVFDDVGTWKIRDTGSGYVFEGADNSAYFTDPGMNPGGLDHVMETGDLGADGSVTHAWEDLPDLGDADFDDVVFEVATNYTVEVSFASEDAGYQSTYGWYHTGTGEAEILVANVDTDTNPDLADFTATLSLTADEIQHLDFFLIPDGYNQNGDPGEPLANSDGTDLDLKVVETNGVWQLQDMGTGRIFEGLGAPAYFTEADKNPAGNDHVMEDGDLIADGAVTHNWEDLPGLGDQDFNDVVFDVTLGCGIADPGKPGNDSLMGGAGGDTLDGGPGSDTMEGNAGADVFVFGLAGDGGGGSSEAPSDNIDWVQWKVADGGNGHWYAGVETPQGIWWEDAKAAAEALGPDTHLATITSEHENSFVFELIDDARFWKLDVPSGTIIGPWLGGFQPEGSPEPSGGWEWVTGDPFSYTNWHPWQPDDAGGSEDFAHFWAPPGGTTTPNWNDISSNRNPQDIYSGFVVESPFGPTAVPSTDTITDFSPGEDELDLTAFAFPDFDAVTALAEQVDGDTRFRLSEAGGDDALLKDVNLFELSVDDFIL